MLRVVSSFLTCLLLVLTTLIAEGEVEKPTGVPLWDATWVSPRGTLTSATLWELARPSQVEPSRWLPFARQGGSQGAQQRGWVRRHPVLFGTLVGVGAGAVFGEFYFGRKLDLGPHPLDMLYGAGIGAGIGSLLGFVLGR